MQPCEQLVRLLSAVGLCCSALLTMVLQSALAMSVLKWWRRAGVSRLSLYRTVADWLCCVGSVSAAGWPTCSAQWPAVHWKRAAAHKGRY